MRYIFPLNGMKRFSEATGEGELAELQRFAKRFLRLVVLVAVTFVKLVRALANYIRTHRHAFAAVLACPILGSPQQSRTCSDAALPFGHDKPVHFRADLNLQQWLFANMHPPDHSVCHRVRYEYGMLRWGLDSVQPLVYLHCRRWIPELSGEHGNLRHIIGRRPPNLQFIFGRHDR